MRTLQIDKKQLTFFGFFITIYFQRMYMYKDIKFFLCLLNTNLYLFLYDEKTTFDQFYIFDTVTNISIELYYLTQNATIFYSILICQVIEDQ